MSNNKETAVEWLFHQLWEEPKDKFTWYAILKKAKEMEKEQTEISDEEVEDKAEEFEFTNGIYGFKQGVKWYREQLKKKQ